MKRKSADLQSAEVKAQEIENKLSAYDFGPMTYVYVKTDEGYEARIPSAFVLQHKDWYLIFAEHHDFLTFHKDDVTEIYQYEIKVTHKITNVRNFKPRPKP